MHVCGDDMKIHFKPISVDIQLIVELAIVIMMHYSSTVCRRVEGGWVEKKFQQKRKMNMTLNK